MNKAAREKLQGMKHIENVSCKGRYEKLGNGNLSFEDEVLLGPERGLEIRWIKGKLTVAEIVAAYCDKAERTDETTKGIMIPNTFDAET